MFVFLNIFLRKSFRFHSIESCWSYWILFFSLPFAATCIHTVQNATTCSYILFDIKHHKCKHLSIYKRMIFCLRTDIFSPAIVNCSCNEIHNKQSHHFFLSCSKSFLFFFSLFFLYMISFRWCKRCVYTREHTAATAAAVSIYRVVHEHDFTIFFFFFFTSKIQQQQQRRKQNNNNSSSDNDYFSCSLSIHKTDAVCMSVKTQQK